MRNPLSLVQKIEKITDVEKRRLFLAKFVWELPDNGKYNCRVRGPVLSERTGHPIGIVH